MGRNKQGIFGVKVGTKFVNTNKKMPKEDRQYFTESELAVIDSGKFETDVIEWGTVKQKGKEAKPPRMTPEQAEKMSDYEFAQNLIMWFARTKIASDNGKKLPAIGGKKQSRSEFSEVDTILYGVIEEMVLDINEENEV